MTWWYYHQGYYETDQYVGDAFTPGQTISVTADGKLTGLEGEPSATAGNVAVGKFIKMKGSNLFFRLEL